MAVVRGLRQHHIITMDYSRQADTVLCSTRITLVIVAIFALVGNKT